jgi:hypothetical protein
MATHAKLSSKVLRFFLRTAAYQFTMDESAESLLQSLRNPTFELNPAELMDEIRPLFRQGIIDASMTSLAEFEREAKRDRVISLQQHADRFQPITATAQSISYWRRWKDSSSLYNSSIAHKPPKSTPASVPARPEGWKTGRNEPCPCGSGKKYKKCCGRLPQ